MPELLFRTYWLWFIVLAVVAIAETITIFLSAGREVFGNGILADKYFLSIVYERIVKNCDVVIRRLCAKSAVYRWCFLLRCFEFVGGYQTLISWQSCWRGCGSL